MLFVAAARGRGPAADVLAAGNETAGNEAAGKETTGSETTGSQTTAPDGAGVAAATRTLPRDIGSFTGREAELGRLLAALADDQAAGDLRDRRDGRVG